MRRSTVSGSFFDVRISRNSRLASSFSRSLASISLSERVIARMASGWKARLCFCARWKMRIRLTGSRLNTFGVRDA